LSKKNKKQKVNVEQPKNKMIKTENKEKENRFIQIIKKKWLIEGTTTLALVSIIIAAFICLNIFMHNLELTPIDLSQEQLFTLSEESKDKVRNIDKDVNIYFIEYTSDNPSVELSKQYHSVNEKIKTEIVTAESRPDLVQKYGIQSGSQGIIVECGEKSKVLTDNDLYTYDMTTYETINVAEEKLTSSIITVTSEKIPKIYFLEGYSSYSLAQQMKYLGIFLQNEINEVKQLNILSTGKVPDDCDTLIICSPEKDFDDMASNAIIDYINSGRNILWLNSAVTKESDLTNVNKVLSMYGVKPFEVGTILETDENKMVAQTPYIIFPNINYSVPTKSIYNTEGVIFINATKINTLSEEELSNLNISKQVLLSTSSKSFFRSDFSIQSVSKTEKDEEGEFVVGAELVKTITAANEEEGKSAVKSKMIILGDNNFITDYPIGNSNSPVIRLAKNKDLVLNSMAYLVDREEDITARKSTGTVTYTATQEQDNIIIGIIFGVPFLILIAGLVVWILRRIKK